MVDQNLLYSGIWCLHERKTIHINLLELRAMPRQDQVRNHTVRMECDNTTAVSYLNKQGGTISRTLCNKAMDLFE